MTHDLTIAQGEYDLLATGAKHFVVLPDTHPPLHYGDVLVLRQRHSPQPLVRWVRYAESGAHLRPDWVAVEVAP